MPIKIRPAMATDIPQVHAIYSYYVQETVVTFMQNSPPLLSLMSKFQDITGRGLPFLVAVDDGADTETGTETVLGYTYLSPFRGTMLSYGPTVELSLFVHRSHTNRGLGSLLLSTLLASLNNGGVKHLAREHPGIPGYEVVAPDGGAPVRNVIACMALDTKDGKDGGEGLRRWYEKRGFVERGRLKGVGFKKGRW